MGASLERYAEVLAHLLYFKEAKPSAVLERLGVDAGDWASADRTWSKAIGDELKREDTTLAQRLSDALTPPQRRLKETQPTLEMIGPLGPEGPPATDPSPPPEAPPVVEAPPEPMPVPVVQVPTCALVANAPQPMPPFEPPAPPLSKPIDLGATMEPRISPLLAEPVLPFRPADAPTRGPSQPEAAAKAPVKKSGTTAVLPVLDFSGAKALPFVEGAAPKRSATAPQIERYAWLVATFRKAAPADLPATLARFGLTTESRKELEAQWAKRMAEDASLREAFLAALARHLGTGGG